jgi:hypothetical protein
MIGDALCVRAAPVVVDGLHHRASRRLRAVLAHVVLPGRFARPLMRGLARPDQMRRRVASSCSTLPLWPIGHLVFRTGDLALGEYTVSLTFKYMQQGQHCGSLESALCPAFRPLMSPSLPISNLSRFRRSLRMAEGPPTLHA